MATLSQRDEQVFPTQILSVHNHLEESALLNESKVNHEFDAAKADAFASNIIDTLNKAALSLMISLGHRSGLFDAMQKLPASTSTQIARAANLNERYVREWLGAMVTSGVVTLDPERQLFWLPPEHAAFLARKAGSDNIAVFTQYVALMGAVEDDILTCFKDGGGVPYSKFPRFHDVMAEDSGQSVLSSLESHILPQATCIRISSIPLARFSTRFRACIA